MVDAALNRRLDLALAKRCLAGDRGAQRGLFDGHKKRVHIVLYRIMGSNRHMEDLVQDAFLEIFRSLPHFRGEATLATWVDRITARVAYRQLSRGHAPAAHLETVPDLRAQGPSPDTHTAARRAARGLYAALDRLEPKYRIAFALHVIEGRSLADVASVTGASVVAVKSRVHRARKKVEEKARRNPELRAFLDRGETDE
jgi:RNA polymerase sigma-70 factor (ECF subfamily)